MTPDGKLSRRERMIRIAAVLGATAFVYGFLSPDFTFDVRSALLIASLVVGLGIVTFLAEGGSAIIATHRLGARSSVELYAAAIAVAIVCVVLSRLVDFQPGIVYGFVASNLMVAPAVLSRRQNAQVVIIPALGLLAASLCAWVLLIPLQPAAHADGGWFLALLDSIAGIVFVAGLEGLFYSMIPLTFLDGKVVFDWSPWVWALMFGTATFLFWELVINEDAAYLDAFKQTRVVTALALVAVYAVVTFGTWAFFKARESRGEGGEHEAVAERAE
jgi:hypothetical protein